LIRSGRQVPLADRAGLTSGRRIIPSSEFHRRWGGDFRWDRDPGGAVALAIAGWSTGVRRCVPISYPVRSEGPRALDTDRQSRVAQCGFSRPTQSPPFGGDGVPAHGNAPPAGEALI
jgi:hypothetical protein